MGQDKVRSLEAALGVLGPVDIATKEQIQEAPRRAKEGHQPVRANPDTPRQSPRLWMHWVVLERLMPSREEGSRGRTRKPVAELVKECKEFIERSTKRITKLKTELETETGVLEDSRARLARLEAEAAPVGDPVVAEGARVLTLQPLVNQLHGERDSLSQRRLRPIRLRVVDFDFDANSRKNSLEAWRRLQKRYDHTTGGKKRNILRTIISPGRCSLRKLQAAIARWESYVGRYEKLKGKMDDEVKRAGLESLVPEELENHLILNSNRLKTFEDARSEIVTYVEEKIGLRIRKPSEAGFL